MSSLNGYRCSKCAANLLRNNSVSPMTNYCETQPWQTLQESVIILLSKILERPSTGVKNIGCTEKLNNHYLLSESNDVIMLRKPSTDSSRFKSFKLQNEADYFSYNMKTLL